MRKPKRSIFGLINRGKPKLKTDNNKLNDFVIGEEEAFERKREGGGGQLSALDDVIGNEHGIVQERQKSLPRLDFDKLNRMSAKEQIRTLKQAYIDTFDEFEIKVSEQMKLESDLSNAKLETGREKKERLTLREFIREFVGLIPDAYDLKLKMDTTDWSLEDVEAEINEKMHGLNEQARGELGDVENENEMLHKRNEKLEEAILKYKKDVLRYENGLEKYKENNEKIKARYYELVEKFKQLREVLREERSKGKELENEQPSVSIEEIEEMKEKHEAEIASKSKQIQRKESEVQRLKKELRETKKENEKLITVKKQTQQNKKENSPKKEKPNMFDKIAKKRKAEGNTSKEEEKTLKDEDIVTERVEDDEFDVDLELNLDDGLELLSDDELDEEFTEEKEVEETSQSDAVTEKRQRKKTEKKKEVVEKKDDGVDDEFDLGDEFSLSDIELTGVIDESEEEFELDESDLKEIDITKEDEVKTDEKEIPTSELPKYVFIDTDLYTNDMDEMHEYLVRVIGETGISRNSKLREYIRNDSEGKELFMSNNKINNNDIYSKIKDLREKSVLNHEQVKLGGMHAYNFTSYELSDVGKSYYYKLVRKLPKKSEMELIKKEHDSLSHGYLIVESSEEFEKMGYKAHTDRKSCTFKIANNKRKVFDLVLEKDGKKMCVEVETGTHNEDDFANAMDKIYEVTQDVYFVAPNSNILIKETKTNVFKWINNRGGIENMRGKLTLNFTTLDKIKKNAKTLWETMPL